MNAWQIKALIEWYKMLEGSAKGELQSQYGHLIPEETDIGIPSGIERGDIEAKRKFLEAQGRAERKGLREAPPVDLPPERTLQGQLESLEVPTVPGKELEVRTPQAPVTRYPGTLSSYSIPERGIEAPDIHVDPSGQARIVSDYYDSIVNYRKSKTGEVGKYMESFDPVEQARRLSQVEQVVPEREAGGFIPTQEYTKGMEMQQRSGVGPISTPHTTDTLTAQRIEGQTAYDKRMAKLRAEQATKTSKFAKLVQRYQRAAGRRLRDLKRSGAFRFRGGGGSPTGNQPLIGPIMPKLYRPPQRLQ